MHKSAIAAIGVVFAIGVGLVCRDSGRLAPERRMVNVQPGIVAPDVELGSLHASTRAKREAALRVIRERLSLLEAADLFHAANGPEGVARLRRATPGATVQEQLCRQVIMYVEGLEQELVHSPLPVSGRAAVLTAELECLRANGAFALILFVD